MTELKVNASVWSSALAKLPFKELEAVVSDMIGHVWEMEAKKTMNEATYELYDILHDAIKKKWTFAEYNPEKTPTKKIEELAHNLNMEYLRWHPEKWNDFALSHPEYKKEIAVLKRKRRQ